VTTPTTDGVIPTPTISAAAYDAPTQSIGVTVTPAVGTPAGVLWTVQHAAVSGGPYTPDEESTDTVIAHYHGQERFVDQTDYLVVVGTKTGWTASVLSNEEVVSIPHGRPVPV
jgi:hypothetical protein